MTSKLPPNYFIAGTDTHVGKTVVSLLFMQFYYACGFQPFYLKPLQTGCSHPNTLESDARFIYEHIPELKHNNPSDSVIYCFKEPKAPWFAARNEFSGIHYDQLIDTINLKICQHSPVIIESAGGLMVPIDQSRLMIDLLSDINAIPILVARAGLGTINHTLLSINAMKERKLKPYGIMLSESDLVSPSHEMIEENIEAIKRFSGVKVMGILKKTNDFNCLYENNCDLLRNNLP
jgi:dethiobiotin synthetase